MATTKASKQITKVNTSNKLNCKFFRWHFGEAGCINGKFLSPSFLNPYPPIILLQPDCKNCYYANRRLFEGA